MLKQHAAVNLSHYVFYCRNALELFETFTLVDCHLLIFLQSDLVDM